MKTIALLAAVLALSPAFASPEEEAAKVLREIQRSHIEGNVPPAEKFDEFLLRDLLLYFRRSNPATTRIEYELLRKEPTQSGVAYPKFYLWARATSSETALVEGAVRVVAIDRTHFEVSDYLSKDAITSNPKKVGTIFPSLLVPNILARAGAQ